MGSVLLRVAGNMAKRQENQGKKGYSLGIWSWSLLWEAAEIPCTGNFPKVVEQARWGGTCSWEVSPAGQLCSIFCVVFQAWRCGCAACQASAEHQLSGMASLQDSRAPWSKGWEIWGDLGRRGCRHTHGRGGNRPLPPNCQPGTRDRDRDKATCHMGIFRRGWSWEDVMGWSYPLCSSLRAEPVMEAHLSTRHSSGSGILQGSCFALGCLEESCSSTGFNSQPCLQPAASGLAAGLEMLSRKKINLGRAVLELLSLCDGEHKAGE